MQIAEVIGNVTLSKWHPTLSGATWLLAVPLDRRGIAGDAAGRAEPYVLYDELGAGMKSLIGVAEGAEASAPFYPDQKPIDAYNAAIFDHIDIEPANNSTS